MKKQNKEDDKVFISFQLPIDLHEQVKTAAQEKDRTVSSYIRQALVRAVQQ